MAQHFPNIHAVAMQLSTNDPELNVDELEAWAKDRVKPGIMWFLQKFNVQLLPMMEVFRSILFSYSGADITT